MTDLTGNPAHVLAAIAKERGEPLNEALVQQMAAFCDEELHIPMAHQGPRKQMQHGPQRKGRRGKTRRW